MQTNRVQQRSLVDAARVGDDHRLAAAMGGSQGVSHLVGSTAPKPQHVGHRVLLAGIRIHAAAAEGQGRAWYRGSQSAAAGRWPHLARNGSTSWPSSSRGHWNISHRTVGARQMKESATRRDRPCEWRLGSFDHSFVRAWLIQLTGKGHGSSRQHPMPT